MNAGPNTASRKTAVNGRAPDREQKWLPTGRILQPMPFFFLIGARLPLIFPNPTKPVRNRFVTNIPTPFEQPTRSVPATLGHQRNAGIRIERPMAIKVTSTKIEPNENWSRISDRRYHANQPDSATIVYAGNTKT